VALPSGGNVESAGAESLALTYDAAVDCGGCVDDQCVHDGEALRIGEDETVEVDGLVVVADYIVHWMYVSVFPMGVHSGMVCWVMLLTDVIRLTSCVFSGSSGDTDDRLRRSKSLGANSSSSCRDQHRGHRLASNDCGFGAVNLNTDLALNVNRESASQILSIAVIEDDVSSCVFGRCDWETPEQIKMSSTGLERSAAVTANGCRSGCRDRCGSSLENWEESNGSGYRDGRGGTDNGCRHRSSRVDNIIEGACGRSDSNHRLCGTRNGEVVGESSGKVAGPSRHSSGQINLTVAGGASCHYVSDLLTFGVRGSCQKSKK
jgi:hypothetical protein